MVNSSVPMTLLSLKQLLSEETRLVVIDFYAEWCGPCKRIAPEIEQLENKYNHRILVLKINVDECEDIAAEFAIQSMPTILFIKEGRILDTVVGANMTAIHRNIQLYGN